MAALEILRVGHVNHVATDYDAAIAGYRRVLGGVPFREWALPALGTRNALVTVSDVCIELFAAAGEGPMTSWSIRHGEAWHSIEWTVPDLDAAEAVCAERGLRITDCSPGNYVFTHPRDGHGLCIELTAARFPGDPRDDPTIDPQPSYWRDEHPLGIEGLDRVLVTAVDADASAAWLADIAGGQVTARRDLPGIVGRGVAVRLPGHTIEYVTPTGDGAARDALEARGEHLWLLSLAVADLDRARDHLASVGVPTTPGSHDAAVAIEPGPLRGATLELTQR